MSSEDYIRDRARRLVDDGWSEQAAATLALAVAVQSVANKLDSFNLGDGLAHGLGMFSNEGTMRLPLDVHADVSVEGA